MKVFAETLVGATGIVRSTGGGRLAIYPPIWRCSVNLNVGFAHRPQRMKHGIRFSRMLCSHNSFRRADAMNTVCFFVVKFASLIVWTLFRFSPGHLKGHLSISRVSEFEHFVDYVLKSVGSIS